VPSSPQSGRLGATHMVCLVPVASGWGCVKSSKEQRAKSVKEKQGRWGGGGGSGGPAGWHSAVQLHAQQLCAPEAHPLAYAHAAIACVKSKLHAHAC
jgi:hypothetical protein